MISDLLYRWMYRREIRERQERMSAVAEVWRQRQVENDARWEAADRQMKADFEHAKQLPPDEFLEWARLYRGPSVARTPPADRSYFDGRPSLELLEFAIQSMAKQAVDLLRAETWLWEQT